jgi:hypothetical protein
MKRNVLLALVLFLVSFWLIGCVDTSFDLSTVDIEAVDQIDVPAGTYRVPYTIEDLSNLVKNYGATVTVEAVNRANEVVEVSGDTFVVVENEVYTVTIRLTVGEESKVKTITITAVVVQTSSVTVTFDLQGGEGSIPNQTVAIGALASAPGVEPTKAGFRFLGWYDAPTGGGLFVFDSTQVYQNITIYARYEEIITNERKVTYDLNGAIQTQEWSELVVHGELAVGPTLTPVRQGHLFLGWAYDPDGIMLFDFGSTPIESNLTLYAVWHVDFIVVSDGAAFEEASARPAFDLVDGTVMQKYEMVANLDIRRLELDHSINETRVEFGVLYGFDNTALEYYSKRATKLLGDNEEANLDGVRTLFYRLTTESLMPEASYFYRFFVRFEQTIVYGEVLELQTLIVVKNGTAVGLDGILGGGVYKIDNGTDVWRPQKYVFASSGYELDIDGATYSNFAILYREGIRSIVSIDLSTGKRYLHVFKLDFQTPHVQITLKEIQTEGGDAVPTFAIIYPNFEHIHYPTPQVGILYSKTFSFLKLGVGDGSVRSATINAEHTTFTANVGIHSSSDVLYVRGYATINGKTSYSNNVYRLTKDVEGMYQIDKTIQIDLETMSPQYGYSWSFGPTGVVRVYRYVSGEWVYTSHQNEVNIQAVGEYFVQMEGVDHVTNVVITEDFPRPTGIEHNQVYVGSVLATIDAYNADWYVSYNGGDYVYLPSSIRFEQVGTYEVYVRGPMGYELITFEITNPAQ